MTRRIIVRSANAADIPVMVGVLARAFYDDPPMVWMLPDHQSRDRRLRRMFVTILRHEAMRHGGVDVAWSGDRIVGAAVWMPPDTWKPPSAAQQLRSAPGFMHAFGRRISAASALLSASLKAHPAQSHWYLSFIGVDPKVQGSGAGAALIRSKQAHMDALGQPSFLESSKVSNVPLYEHFGYAVTGKSEVPDGAPVLTPMWRDAVSGAPFG
jgi:ribosomal protein S18 acetylase RimI-like enzyme